MAVFRVINKTQFELLARGTNQIKLNKRKKGLNFFADQIFCQNAFSIFVYLYRLEGVSQKSFLLNDRFASLVFQIVFVAENVTTNLETKFNMQNNIFVAEN